MPPLSLVLSRTQLGVVVFLAALALFAFTTSASLVGYEGETAAVTHSLVKRGGFRIADRAAGAVGGRGRAGGRYGRSTLPQPLLEVPFVLPCTLTSGGDCQTFLTFF